MAPTLPGIAPARLEQSCAPRDWIRHAPPDPVVERFEAFFAGHAYDPHRHDVYAVGYTLNGVQVFGYRGAQVGSATGNAMVIHPDELHDGHAGVPAGFRYRMAYLEPQLIRAALGDDAASLPFVPAPVVSDARLTAALLPLLGDLGRPMEPLERDGALGGVAAALQALAGSARRATKATCAVAVERARGYLDAHFTEGVDSGALERACGLDRFSLARHFRHRLGTSPYRYLTLRRLASARRAIAAGCSLADAAGACGFADQSHMTRQFKRTYGLPPGRWQALLFKAVSEWPTPIGEAGRRPDRRGRADPQAVAAALRRLSP